MNWEQAIEKKNTDKKYIVKLYTVWCGYCTKMDNTTFKDDKVASYMNENYIPIKFDGESKEDVTVNGTTYKYVAPGENGNRRGYHELAAALLNGKLQYPSTVILDEELKVIDVVAGYRKADEFEKYITYFGGNHHLDTPWRDYKEAYKSK